MSPVYCVTYVSGRTMVDLGTADFLGLSIAKVRHGGIIWAESNNDNFSGDMHSAKPRWGTKISFTLPVT